MLEKRSIVQVLRHYLLGYDRPRLRLRTGVAINAHGHRRLSEAKGKTLNLKHPTRDTVPVASELFHDLRSLFF